MRLKWVRQKLQRWAAWLEGRGNIKGIQLSQVGGGSGSGNDAGVKIDEDSLLVDQVIRELESEHQEIIRLVYIETPGGDLDRVAEKMVLNRSSVYRRIFEAEKEFAIQYDEKIGN